MITTTAQPEAGPVATLQILAVADAEKAIALANRWLHRDVGLLIHVSRAVFNAATCSWHLPVELAYPRTGLLGVIGDIYLNAADGQFIGLPAPEELQRRATVLACANGFTEKE